VLGYPNDHFRIIKEIQPDIIVLGYDQRPTVEELESDLKARGIGARVVRLEKRTGDIDGTRKIITKILEERGKRC
ncbi:MAG: FAD synthase, partial [Thermoplasmata archaeon]|nr:FAD synthase [Thermoplasmata archaeon]